MERFSFIFLIAGIGFFALAFAVSGYIPMLPVADLEVRTVEQLAAQPPLDFYELAEQYPEAFEKAFGRHKAETGEYDMPAAFEEALRLGHRTYIGEACWHCHSQQVRPWGHDEDRYGRVSFPEEYHHELAQPPLWGTRRVGPDLIRLGGTRSNDWHVAHFWHPPDVNPLSVMPDYRWFFEKDDPATPGNESLTPNKTGLSIIAYVQWLGSWIDAPRETLHHLQQIDRQYDPPVFIDGPSRSPAPAAAPTPAAAEPAPAEDEGY